MNKTSVGTDLPNTLEVGVSPRDVGLGNTEHVHGSLVEAHEHTVVDLTQSEQLQDFADLWDKKKVICISIILFWILEDAI